MARPLISRFACYYGTNALEVLSTFDLAILQGSHYSRDQINWLQSVNTQCIAYLSLGELPAQEAASAWRLSDPAGGPTPPNPHWGTVYLDCRRPAWQDEVLQRRVPEIMQRGFAGLFLDTIDVQDLFPATRPGVVQMVQRLHACFPTLLLAANRGFSVLPQIMPALDAVVFEAFTTHCQNRSYAPWTGPDLLWTEGKAVELRATCGDRAILALDYAAPEDDTLRRLAEQRAAEHGFASFVTTRYVDWLPMAVSSGR
jgi:hypothetical protein